jgi:hypothetical protein
MKWAYRRKSNLFFTRPIILVKQIMLICQQPAFWIPLLQPPTGDKNKY